MESEKLKIFDANRNEIGVATREEVHRLGHWHETFHCWFTSREDGVDYIYFQLRSEQKKDYPDLLDITAAGHLLADENIDDGVREVEEELGIPLSMSELIPLVVIGCSYREGNFIDNEFCNVYLYHRDQGIDEFILQTEEVAGMMKTEVNNFYGLWCEDKDEIPIEGFLVNEDGEKVQVHQHVKKGQFVPNTNSYYETVIKAVRKFLSERNKS